MPSRRKKSLQSRCSVDFDFLGLMKFDMTFDVTLRDDSSFGQLTNSCNVLFSLLLVTFSIKAIFLKRILEEIHLRFPGSLKPSSSICYVLFSSKEKYFLISWFWALLEARKLGKVHMQMLAIVFSLLKVSRLNSQSKFQMFKLFSGRHIGIPRRYTNLAFSYWAL